MNTKQLMAFLTAASLALGVANAAVVAKTYNFNTGFANAGVVPDNNPSGWQNTQTIPAADWAGTPWFVTNVQVTLSASSGYAGDLYAYLTHDSGFSVLLNRVGRSSTNSSGYSVSGFAAMVLADTAAADVHFGGATSPGPWQPDGRTLSPLATASSFDSAARTAMLSSFLNLTPSGDWTLFIADLSSGSVSTITEWSLEITAVPEPRVGLVLTLVGMGIGVGKLVIRRKKAK